jgi:hypothetical protein
MISVIRVLSFDEFAASNRLALMLTWREKAHLAPDDGVLVTAVE